MYALPNSMGITGTPPHSSAESTAKAKKRESRRSSHSRWRFPVPVDLLLSLRSAELTGPPMTDAVPIGTFFTRQAAEEGACLLRANQIKCAVIAPPRTVSGLGLAMGDRPEYTVIVAPGDEQSARDSLEGFLGATWFLRTSDGRPSHSFETATPKRLRYHATAELEGDTQASNCIRLAGLLEQHRSNHVWDALKPDRRLAGLTLDEWARACGCEVAPPQTTG
jgi:hypothetical protein